MNPGHGETSYARNSSFQNAEQNRMKPLITSAAITDLCSNTNTLLLGKLMVVDVGCSSGRNAVALVSTAIDAIQSHCLQINQPPPEVCVLLNDLPDNDFSMVVKTLVTLRESKKTIVVTSVAPGSFYERLFTSNSLHLVCSSNSLHWLSKAPEDLTRNHIPAFDIDEHARRERLPMVRDAYALQFKKDFSLFLELRAKELVSGGRMVISLVGTRSNAIASKFILFLGIVAQILSVLVAEGVIDKAKFYSFYMPLYGPSSEELREISKAEGSFSIREMRVHDPRTEMSTTLSTSTRFVNNLRALFEPIIVQHFGKVMDKFAMAAELYWILDGSLQEERARTSRAMLAVSLVKA
ncbi:salicylate/benzoate carboxyl methyltransferase-like [Triticum dicoccoides]|uniref:salicylate/benzoate carboxyl methyltransferase-like n=1 Tax=Triticum dicoccoides TaxID=85692 RepID=UPI00188ED8B9|nr:salicylate/benzoate carboxyl methyltransferase-like [Triticum dicoccoides]